MSLAIRLSQLNVEQGTGGPFGAAVFDADSGSLTSIGMNLVVTHNNSTLHAEMVALMMAQMRVRSYSLRSTGQPERHLYTSCDPCAMCLGAILWSGVSRIVAGATREDARALGFEEGPVFPESYDYLEDRGVAIQRGVLGDEAASVLRAYGESDGVIYNG